MNMINQATNYISGEDKYSLILQINITCMMVLASVYLSVSASLPTTSGIKPVEVWLLANISYPFLVILVNIAQQVLHREKQKKEKNKVPVHSNTSAPRGCAAGGGGCWGTQQMAHILFVKIGNFLKSSCSQQHSFITVQLEEEVKEEQNHLRIMIWHQHWPIWLLNSQPTPPATPASYLRTTKDHRRLQEQTLAEFSLVEIQYWLNSELWWNNYLENLD